MSTTVLLVDDHEVVRKGIGSLLTLTDDFEVIGEAGGGAEAIELARELAPDLFRRAVYIGSAVQSATGNLKAAHVAESQAVSLALEALEREPSHVA